MNLKQFQKIKLGITALLAALMAIAVIQQNYILAVVAVIASMLVIRALKKQVKEVTVDERDLEIGGKAARLSLSIFSIVGAVTVFVLLTLRDRNPDFELIGLVLAYAVCGLMMLYSLAFNYYYRGVEGRRRFWYLFLVVIVILGFAIAGLRGFSGEDNWICQNGQWIKHGQPSWPMPAAPCRK